jgi:hypothetical protein
MARKRRRPQQRSRTIWWWIGGGVLVLAAIMWFATHPPIPGEIGIPVTTLVGQRAPALEFPDAAGRRYQVPQPGRITVLIFHMGLH